MNIEQQVRLLKMLPKNTLQEVSPRFETPQRDPKSVELENAVNKQMQMKLQEQGKPIEIATKSTNGVKHISVEDALKELSSLMSTQPPPNKS